MKTKAIILAAVACVLVCSEASGETSRMTEISFSYMYSIGMINTHGISVSGGLRMGKHFIGGIANAGMGWEKYDSIGISPSNSPVRWGVMTDSRVMLGLGGLYHYKAWHYSEWVRAYPGFALGFWELLDIKQKNHNHYEFWGPRFKVSVGPGAFSSFAEMSIIMNFQEVTPQLLAGLSFVF